MPGERPRKAASRSLGAGRSRHGDRRREKRVPAGAGDQHRGYRQQVDGQGARDRLALPASPGYVPPVDGDLEGCRSGHDAGRQRAAGDVDDLALVAGAGPGVQQLAGAIAERPGGVSAARSPSCAPGSSPTRPVSMPSPARRPVIRRRAVAASAGPIPRMGSVGGRSSGVTAGTDAERVADRRFKEPGTLGRPCRPGCRGSSSRYRDRGGSRDGLRQAERREQVRGR